MADFWGKDFLRYLRDNWGFLALITIVVLLIVALIIVLSQLGEAETDRDDYSSSYFALQKKYNILLKELRARLP